MVGSADIPAGVARFIERHVNTLERLELLLLLMQTPDRWWDAGSIAHRLGFGTDEARRALDHLAAHNLLAISVTGDVRYQYQPGEPTLAEAARLFAEAFNVNRLGVLQLVSRPDHRGIRDFADAFRIKRTDDR